MVAMARKGRRGASSIKEPLFNFQFLVILMSGFLALIGVVVVFAAVSRSSPGTSTAKNARHFSDPSQIPAEIVKDLDAILILGGGVPESVDSPPIYVKRRADDAMQVILQHQQIASKKQASGTSKNALPVLCLSAGTAHLPQALSPDGLPIWEATSCAGYLATKHGLMDNVFVETTSYDTIGNAFFTRTSHTDVNGWRRLLVITNEFHMARTAAIFDWIFGCPPNGGSKQSRSNKNGYELYYLSSPNVGLSEEAVSARKEREDQSAKNVREKLATKYTTMALVWSFLNKEHALYTADKLIERGRGSGLNKEAASEIVKKSYGLSSEGKS